MGRYSLCRLEWMGEIEEWCFHSDFHWEENIPPQMKVGKEFRDEYERSDGRESREGQWSSWRGWRGGEVEESEQ